MQTQIKPASSLLIHNIHNCQRSRTYSCLCRSTTIRLRYSAAF